MISPIHFLICNGIISILLLMLLLVRKICRRHLIISMRYHLWRLFTVILFLPFFPWNYLFQKRWFLWFQNIFFSGTTPNKTAVLWKDGAADASPGSVIHDFSKAVASSNLSISQILWGIWITGIVVVSFYFIGILWNIHRIKKQAFPVTETSEPELYTLFLDCHQTISLRRTVRLYASCEIQNPVSGGWLFPTVIIPQDLDIVSSPKDLRYIFLHELQHCKNGDALFNLFICILEVLYWFNPLLWYGFSQLQQDREIACDHAVINKVGDTERLHYGLMILHYASQIKTGAFVSPLSGISSNTTATRQRILEITEYKKSSCLQKIQSAGIFILVFILLFTAAPLLSAYASQAPGFHLTNENWTEITTLKSFQGNDGSFVLYDMQKDCYSIYNKEKSEKRISPASTFKIYSGLFALEEGLITPTASTQKWDGSRQPFSQWMQDQTLTSAMQRSVNWYFQNLDVQMGFATLTSYYTRIAYGNCDISGGIKNYWSDSSLKISPVEQVHLLSDLLQNRWEFAPENIQAIKDSLFLYEDSVSGNRLYGKTGTTASESGWFIGFLETAKTTYCFAVNVQGNDCNGSVASDVFIQTMHELFPAISL